jgi:hypothetical protein
MLGAVKAHAQWSPTGHCPGGLPSDKTHRLPLLGVWAVFLRGESSPQQKGPSYVDARTLSRIHRVVHDLLVSALTIQTWRFAGCVLVARGGLQGVTPIGPGIASLTLKLRHSTVGSQPWLASLSEANAV